MLHTGATLSGVADVPTTGDRPPPDPAVTVEGDQVRLHGVAAIRAMAHPARLRVIDELYSGRVERTATELAALVGLSPSAVSYHLRALERAAIIERAPARPDSRERPWRGRGRTISIDSSERAASAGDVLVSMAFDRTRELYDAWVDHRRRHGGGRSRRSASANGLLWLTDAETGSLIDEVNEVVDHYGRLTADRSGPGDIDADRIAWLWTVFPDVSARPGHTAGALHAVGDGDGDIAG